MTRGYTPCTPAGGGMKYMGVAFLTIVDILSDRMRVAS